MLFRSVGTIVSKGSGTSKKDAKKAAATALLDKLKALGNEVTSLANVPVNGNSAELDEELKQATDINIEVLVSLINDWNKTKKRASKGSSLQINCRSQEVWGLKKLLLLP